MTLSIAACFPWGKLRDVNQSLPLQMRMEEGIVLATDSRFTIGTFPSGRPQHVNNGRKLYPLDLMTGLVFAGDVWTAQEAVKFLRRYRGQRRYRKIGRAGGPAQVATFFLRRAFEGTVPLRERDQRQLFVLIGTMTPTGPVILRFRSPTFNPISLTGVTAVGPNQDIKAFERQLYAAQEQRWKDGNIQMAPELWQMEAVVAMKSALVHPKRTGTIGGSIQSVLITQSRGIQTRNVNWLVEGGDPLKAADWEDLTVWLGRTRGYPLSAAALAPEAGLIFKQVMR